MSSYMDQDMPGQGNMIKTKRRSGAELASIGRYLEALAAFDEDLEQSSDQVLLIGKALTLDRIGMFKASLECCERAIDLEPANPDAWFVRGMTFYWQA